MIATSERYPLILKIAKILHGNSCNGVDCANCHYHDLPSVYPTDDKCPDYYSAIKLVNHGFVDDVIAEFLTEWALKGKKWALKGKKNV